MYDASAKTKKGKKSLNECLHQRPVILEDLTELLMRFRTKRIGLFADIERAFSQVRLQHEDRDVTTFLWLKDIKQSSSTATIDIYRFARVTFGIISSTFLLGTTIVHHLEQKGTPAELQAQDNNCVDNLVIGEEDG